VIVWEKWWIGASGGKAEKDSSDFISYHRSVHDCRWHRCLDLGATYDVHLRLIGKRVVDFRDRDTRNGYDGERCIADNVDNICG